MPATSPNFAFLSDAEPQLYKLATDAERFFAQDPDVSLVRLRQLGEVLALRVAQLCGLEHDERGAQIDLLRKLEDRSFLDRQVSQLLHTLRRTGNQANHQLIGDHRAALSHLQIAYKLAIWYDRAFGGNQRRYGPFEPPPGPRELAQAGEQEHAEALAAELDALRQEAAASRNKAEAAEARAREALVAQESAEVRARREAEDHAAALALASETEAENLRLRDEIARLKALTGALGASPVNAARLRAATAKLELSEAETRALIDEQLRAAGWEVDSRRLRHAAGARPEPGHDRAIAEWPTDDGRADYVLFRGLTPLAVVEAKRQNKAVAAYLGQSARYSRALRMAGLDAPGGPWDGHRVPFLFSTNGRPFLRQVLDQSGVWFRDARRVENPPRALEGWHSPAGLQALLDQNTAQANAALHAEPFDTLAFLRDYQRDAIVAVEAAIASGRREILLAMATGTGKTKTSIALVYRLIKHDRFQRVLFLVDRSALGEQTRFALEETALEALQPFPKIYDMQGLDVVEPASDTRLHLATVQSMVRRLDSARPPNVDQYDAIVVDECHRGYLLDRELGDRDVSFRDESEYVSAYRRVLDRFDAVKIGLTATPALHTVQIFGPPVFRYTYREAVVDGHLVDHDLPIPLVTRLASEGIHWPAGSAVPRLDRRTNKTDLAQLKDKVDIEVDGFNRSVVTEPFNRAVAGKLASHIDPGSAEKTLVFCVDDHHAELFVRVFREELEKRYGELPHDTVEKITGNMERPLNAILRYKNEPAPNIAVTVDLLTTGIDVPRIANLVFLRRVRSRILYEQMLGRATRPCPEIGKTRFRIFDAVDLYASIQAFSDMKPVAVTPSVSLTQVADEFILATAPEDQAARRDELLGRLHRRRFALGDKARAAVEELIGEPLLAALARVQQMDHAQLTDWLTHHRPLLSLLDRPGLGPSYILVSEHADQVMEGQGWKSYVPTQDYLAGFATFIQENRHLLPALNAVVTRPAELTRAELRELRLKLDEAGYSEASLRSAWSNARNVDIAASILGFIRQAALGDPLVPYEERVDHALRRVLARAAWTTPQRRWLDLLARQIKVEILVDRPAFERGVLREQGGWSRADRVLDGRLEEVLGQLHGEIWKEAG